MTKEVPWDLIPEDTGGGGALTNGIKKFEIDSLEETYSSTQKYMIKGTYRVLEPEGEAGLLLFDQYVIGTDSDLGADEGATWAASVGAKILRGVLDKAGVVKKKSMAETLAGARQCQVLGDVVTEVETKNEKYMGKERNRVRRWFRVGERPVTPLTSADAQQPATAAAGFKNFRPGRL